jgi:fructokinase
VLSLGERGCIALTKTREIAVPSVSVKVVDTTGAGDGFVAGLLSGIARDASVLEDERRLFELCRFANAVGAYTATGLGAIPSLPNRNQVEALLSGARPASSAAEQLQHG